MFKYIVLIDDDEATNYYHKYILEENEVTEHIVVADNIEEAVSKLTQLDEAPTLHPSVLLLDISMPKYSGFELLQKQSAVFQSLSQKGLHIIILTTSSNQRDIDTANEIPLINSIWQKPLTDQMIQTLKERFV